ncbi:single-stranded DNA-binding protein [Desulfolithobacter dissulfuricans]|uniref:Single-stranded DNA-binding protein n=1 Tax=Desulfolithobacter dissulfuricans TaxID=2795293 RepID=A0A915XIL6_9BACT|nr:single-stranded DNA-binding protein [Desulfolithobacter dissulfuricans]BCO09310.1 single-stranded DNA-binding protein [Desulfolithobacter dissulfuricans]
MNKAMLIGHLGNDPEIRYTQDGIPVAIFSLATTTRWRDKDGKKQEKAEWHRIVAWRRLAEICGEYLAKGSHVYIGGAIQTRKWEDKSGNPRYVTEIIATEMEMLGSRQENTDSPPQSDPMEPPMPSVDDIPF